MSCRKLDCWLLESSQQQSGLTQRIQNKSLTLLPLTDAAASETVHIRQSVALTVVRQPAHVSCTNLQQLTADMQ